MASFLEKNKDFVLKLKIQTAGGTQIRRVSLPRLADANGDISYEELVGLVLVFSLPEEDANNINTRNYDVTLTYYDEEKDLITLSSTEELVEAVELFAGQKFFRITTSVQPKASYSPPPTSARPYVQNTGGEVTTKNAEYPANPPIQAVLESFAGILSSAVNNLQEGLANQPTAKDSPPKSSPPVQPMKADANVAKANRAAMQKKRRERMELRRERMEARMNKKNATNNASSKKENKPQSTDTKKSPVASADTKKSPVPTPVKKKEPVETKPFIHGRHTCDGCLTTPIVGKRYHATNLPDYDLCQKCFGNYKGSEIKYEPVELRQDIPLQSHWRMRQERREKQMNARNRSARISSYPCAPPRFGSAARPKPATTNPTPPPSSSSFMNYNPNDFNDSLKEAIRRSLDDVAPKEDAIKKADEDEKTKAQKAEPPKSEDTVNSEATEETVSIKKEIVVDNKTPEKNICETQDDIPRSVDIPDKNTAQIERLASGDSVTEKTSLSLDVEDEEALENAMETESVDSEKLVSEDVPKDTGNPSQSPASKASRVNTSRNESFASDAVGNGDVAEVMGKTLDMVAGVIDEMMQESGEMVSRMTEDSGELVKLSEAMEATAREMAKLSDAVGSINENDKQQDDEPKDGEIIVDSNEDVEDPNEGEEDETDWSVVKSIGSNGTTESQKIGRAAEMLGSALFNSDMRSSAEGLGSNIGASDALSVPSSVPTELGTVNVRLEGSNPTSKWASELTKLKELGFDNEETCIEALERVQSDLNKDDFDLDLVVNQLLFLSA